MKIKVVAIAGAFAIGACAGNAWADDNGMYLNMDLGQSDYSGLSFQQVAPAGWTGDVSHGNLSYRLTLGYDVNPYLAVEGGYLDLGHAGVNSSQPGLPANQVGGFLDTRVNAKGWVADLVGKLPLSDRWSLYGRIGVMDAEVGFEVRQNAGVPLTEGGSTDWARNFGVGVSRTLGQGWSLHLGWDRYRQVGEPGVPGQYNINMTTLGLQYRFY